VRGFADFAEPGADRPGLVLRSTGEALGSGRPIAALLRRLSSTDSTVSVQLDEIGGDARAGLLLRQSDEFAVRVECRASDTGMSAELIVRDGEELVLASVALDPGPVTLTARVSPTGISWSAATGHREVALGSTPLSALSTETAGGFVGTTFGPYVAGPEGGTALFVAWTQFDHA
jgi:alpha-N-arabinofuranosidase